MLEEIARNKQRCVLVILGFVLIWIGIGALLGALFGGSSGSRGSAVATGIVIAAIVALLASAYAMTSGGRPLLPGAGARAPRPAPYPQPPHTLAATGIRTPPPQTPGY